MSRRRAKSLKLDQVMDLLLDDTVSSESSDSDSVSQSPKKAEMKSTVKSEKTIEKSSEEPNKKSPSDDTDDDDEDTPLWQLATKRKTPELPKKTSPSKVTLPDIEESEKRKSSSEDDEEDGEDEEDDDDLPLWQLAAKKKNPKSLQKAMPTKVISSNEESDENMDDNAPLAMIVKKSEPLKSSLNQLNAENNKNENKNVTNGLTKTVDQPETKLKIKNKKIASSLRGIYDFLDAESFRYKANAFESDMSSSETNEDSENLFDTADFKENCVGTGAKRTKKLVAQSPVIKMDCMINNKYYISAKNLKRRKMFNN